MSHAHVDRVAVIGGRGGRARPLLSTCAGSVRGQQRICNFYRAKALFKMSFSERPSAVVGLYSRPDLVRFYSIVVNVVDSGFFTVLMLLVKTLV